MMRTEWARMGLGTAAWLVAGAWAVRVSDLVRNLGKIADLSALDWASAPVDGPSLVVVVPARDEAKDIAATIDALMVADYDALEVVAVDDRSTDGTGAILDEYAERWPHRLRVIHIDEPADGWMGKTFAMQLAVEQTESKYVLFTDADVLFSPSILRRAVAYAEQTQAAHLVVMPTMLVRSWGEGAVLGFFQMLAMWAARPWRVSDPNARRDAVGVGAFNMVRRDAWLALGGFEPQRMVVLEDIHVGLRFKAAGLSQRIAFAPETVQVHWARGMRGLVGVMTKNIFSGTNFNPLLMLCACVWIVAFCVLPLAGLAWWPTIVPALIVMLAVAAAYRRMGMFSGIDARYGWLYPLGAMVFVWVMLRSMVTAFLIGGVRWRGTKYALQELRRSNHPRQWERAARERRRLERLRRS
jgi:glycosyltransferase involved in cell wall biosynthesis